MAFAAVVEPPQTRALLKRAVHRHRALSLEGLLERAFTTAFGGLVYAQIWEDPLVDLAAMEVAPHHHIVTIASGGCNALSYLTAGPARVTAVDLNRAHVAMTRLKLAGVRHLESWREFHAFFGRADARQNLDLYRRLIRPALDSETRGYWEGRGWSGLKRIRQFRRNIYRRGLLGRSIGLGHLVARLHGRDPRRLLDCATLAEQRAAFATEIAPLFRSRAVKWLTSYRASLYGLGIPPAQYEALAGGREMTAVLEERLGRLACEFDLRENYFAWQAFGRRYAPPDCGALPPYLEERNFATLRAHADRLAVRHGSLTDVLLAMPAESVDRFVLLDAQDWMTDPQLNALWSAIAHAAAPGARVIFRTAGQPTILPGRLAPVLLQGWHYHAERSAELGLRDRASIYGGFHLYERLS